MSPNDADGMANSVDHESALFAQAYLFETYHYGNNSWVYTEWHPKKLRRS